MKVHFQGTEYPSLSAIPQHHIPSVDSYRQAQIANHLGHTITRTRIHGTNFINHPEVLYPTQESYSHALMVGGIAKQLIKANPMSAPLVIADIGTGSGLMAIAISKQLDIESDLGDVRIVATDIDPFAIEVAQQNAHLNGITTIEFRQRDMLQGLSQEFGKLDIICCNPPWYRQHVATEQPNLPRLATNGGIDGLDFYRSLFMQSREALSSDGFIAVRTPESRAPHIGALCIRYLNRPSLRRITQSQFNPRTEKWITRNIGIIHGTIEPEIIRAAVVDLQELYNRGGRFPELQIE